MVKYNRWKQKIDKLRTTSQVSNVKRKTTCTLISGYDFQDLAEINVVFGGIRRTSLQLKIMLSIFTVVW